MNRFQTPNYVSSPAHRERRGIVLLVVLGMLTLFSVLAVSYLVFTNSQRRAAASINRAETGKADEGEVVKDALSKLLVGSRGPDSSLWGHDLLGDLFGMRDSIVANVAPPTAFTGPASEIAPAQLLGGQFLRFPSLLYLESPSNPRFTPLANPANFPLNVAGVRPLLSIYPYRRNDNEVERRYPGYTGIVTSLPLDPTTHERPSFPHDDELNGRLLTFTGGPLEGMTFPIARYFGDHRTANSGRPQLCGQVVLDVSQNLGYSITVGNDTKTLKEWLDDTLFRIDRLFYDYPAAAASLPPGAQPYASFYVNGRMLNGPGLGWDRPRTQFDPLSGVTGTASLMGVDRKRPVGNTNPVRPFNLNEVVSTDLNITRVERGLAAGAEAVPVTGVPYQVPTGPYDPTNPPFRNGPDVPVALQGHYAIHRLAPEEIPGTTLESFLQDLPPGDTDEPYDAPDYNNLWLSYMPNDNILGEAAPSFVRPGMLNWVVNNQEGSPTVQRLRRALIALQRSTLRPIPLRGDPNVPTAIADRGQGVKRLSYANFTGSNITLGLNEPIDFNSTDPVYLTRKLREVARALAGRDDDGDGVIDSWDVDNNGDGRVDSVWIDAGLALTQTTDGRLVKPLVSYLVEDLGGRVNVNLAGNMAQARNAITTRLSGAVQHTGPIRRPSLNSARAPGPVFDAPPLSTRDDLEEVNLPYGWGYGPAEVDLRYLFDDEGSVNTPIIESAPLSSYVANALIRGPQRILGERLGVFSSNLGRGRPYANMNDPAYGQIVAVPGYLRDPFTASGNDLFGALRNPNRPNLHRFNHPQGLPVDAYGRGSVGLGVNGDLVVGGTSFVVTNGGNTAGDSFDDPYEMDILATTEPDAPYSYADLEALLRGGGFDRGLLSNRLVEIIEDFHTQDVGSETVEQLRRALADSITTHSNSVSSVRGGLSSDYFENTVAATSASSPQAMLQDSIARGLLKRQPTPVTAKQALNAVMWELMPDELRAGKKLNLNRPFGNGFDDDGDGVIDDDNNGRIIAGVPADGANDTQYLGNGGAQTSFSSTRGTNPPNELYNPNAPAAASPYRNVTARAQFARHLYVLAMVLIRDANRDVAFDFPHTYPDVNTFPDSPFIPGTPSNNEERQAEFAQEYRAWKIAQWAVNVADFRDADGVMTRFDYDPYPFDGWDVNLSVSTTYRTVWGLERPELTLEESIAFHDRRVRDTADDPGAQESLLGSDGSASRGDNDMDQWRIPQGSLFLELRSTRSPQPIRTPANEVDPVANTSSYPPELYTYINATNEWALNLGAVTPGNNIPVWRVAVSEIHAPGARVTTSATLPPGAANPSSPYFEAAADYLLQPVGSESIIAAGGAGVTMDRDTATGQPERPRYFIDPATTGNPADLIRSQRAIDRVIFFANTVNPTQIKNTLPDVYDEGQVYYNRIPSGSYPNNAVLVRGGQNVLIGPRARTHIGSKDEDAGGAPTHDPLTDAPAVMYNDYESDQRIELTANRVTYFDVDGINQTPTYGGLAGPVVNATIRPIVGIHAAADPPSGWTNVNTPIGVNVSEPLPYETAPGGRSYYTEPTASLDPANGFPLDSYRDYTNPLTDLPDRPFDDDPMMSELDRAFGIDGQKTGTRTHFKTAYLQRLANPTQPYHAEFNPYITVDYITIDLTVFNGSDDNRRSFLDNTMTRLWVDDNDRAPFATAPSERFATRYKTGKTIVQDKTSADFPNLMHSVNTFPPEVTATAAGAGVAYFPRNLNLDIGVVRDPSAMPPTTPDSIGTQTVHSSTLGYLNHSFGARWQQGSQPYDPVSPDVNQAQPGISPFVGTPYNGFASNVIWLNRPFVSAEELMWVPVSAAGRLPFEFGSSVGQTTSDQYSSANNVADSPVPIPPMLPTAKTPVEEQRYDLNQRFTHLWNYFSSSNNVFAYEPATYESGTGTPKPAYPWLPPTPNAGNGFVGMPDPTPAMTAPYSQVAEKNPSPNFWRLLEWVEVPPPFDFDSQFISPEGDVFTAGQQSLFGQRIDFRTLGIAPAVDGDPRSWTTAFPTLMRGWNSGLGRWENNPAVNGNWNGFWTNSISMEMFRPPFGIRSGLFRSGQINLNTIKNVRVYKALMAGFSTPAELSKNRASATQELPDGLGAFFGEFLRNRRGYTPEMAVANRDNNYFEPGTFPLQTFDHDDDISTAEVPSFDRNIPTQFAGVFKSAMGSVIAPLESMRERPIDGDDSRWRINDPTMPFDPIEQEPIDPLQSTILRRDFSRSSTIQEDKPIFQREPTDTAVTAPQNHERSVVHQQLGITRLSNTATDQSNLFAVWITVGYFEVDAATMNVGIEVGSDTGEIRRPKGFFIIDRSVPVMYEPGVLNNALDTVQLSRIQD